MKPHSFEVNRGLSAVLVDVRSASSMTLLSQGWAQYPSDEIAAVSSDISEKENDVLPWTRWHMRSWHWREVYCLQNYQQRCVPDTRILRCARLAQLSVCERPHVCKLPTLLTSARYPWISNLSISIVSHYFRDVVMYVCTLWGFMERGNVVNYL